MTLNYIEQNLFEYYTVHYIVKYPLKNYIESKSYQKKKRTLTSPPNLISNN